MIDDCMFPYRETVKIGKCKQIINHLSAKRAKSDINGGVGRSCDKYSSMFVYLAPQFNKHMDDDESSKKLN